MSVWSLSFDVFGWFFLIVYNLAEANSWVKLRGEDKILLYFSLRQDKDRISVPKQKAWIIVALLQRRQRMQNMLLFT